MNDSKDLNPETQARVKAWSTLLLVEIDILQGRIEAAQSKIAILTNSLSTLNEWAESVFAYRLKWLEGQLLLAQGYPEKTIILLSGLDLPQQPSLYSPNMSWYNLTSLYVSCQDVLARAYLKMGDFRNAVREYERLTLFNPKQLDLRLIHPLLHFRLGKVYESMELKEKAIERYTKFLDLWKEAEGNPPEIQEARKRVQNLRQ